MLLIDEVSMISADFFSKLEKMAQLLRGNERPFGGSVFSRHPTLCARALH